MKGSRWVFKGLLIHQRLSTCPLNHYCFLKSHTGVAFWTGCFFLVMLRVSRGVTRDARRAPQGRRFLFCERVCVCRSPFKDGVSCPDDFWSSTATKRSAHMHSEGRCDSTHNKPSTSPFQLRLHHLYPPQLRIVFEQFFSLRTDTE